LKEKNRTLKLSNQRLRQINSRITKKQSTFDSPGAKVRKDIKGSHESVKKKLLFYYALVNELSTSFSKATSERDKSRMSTVISGKILKKYRVFSMVRDFGWSIRVMRKNSQHTPQDNFDRKRKKCRILTDELQTSITSFYTRDDNSRQTARKKKKTVKQKKKKKKRILMQSYELRRKFVTEATVDKSAEVVSRTIIF